MDLRGAVAIVTGASSGIGEATALALARTGARVVLAARRIERLEDLAARIEERGGEALAVRCDVADPGDVRMLASVVEETHGRCDALINNAGIPGGGPFADTSFEQIERVVRVNELGVLWTTKAFLPMLIARNEGHIVNMSSVFGIVTTPCQAAYHVSKFGVRGFTE